jgi:hypothetical protein
MIPEVNAKTGEVDIPGLGARFTSNFSTLRKLSRCNHMMTERKAGMAL